MDLESLENMIKLTLEDLKKVIKKEPYYRFLRSYVPLREMVANVINLSHKALPEHSAFFTSVYRSVTNPDSDFNTYAARDSLLHILDIIDIEKSSLAKIQEMKIFESAEEKMKQVNLSFQEKNYTSCFSNLNTALELVLKDKLRIPLTITKVNIAKIVDILVKHKIEPYLYLSEARKHITDIANKMKHTGYSPSKSDCIMAIKAMEDLITQLKSTEMKLSEEIKKKIHEEL